MRGVVGGAGLYVAVDTSYQGAVGGHPAGAHSALVGSTQPTFAELALERTVQVGEMAPYHPGQFYLRELPAIRAVLAGVMGLALIVVDGYVDLDPAGRPGLGAHVHAEFGVPVVGVAKSAFRGATHAVPVRRGRSRRPLHVTAAGISLPDAADMVLAMAGPFRLPDALRRVDALARGVDRPHGAPRRRRART